jgi:hypothetical protein
MGCQLSRFRLKLHENHGNFCNWVLSCDQPCENEVNIQCFGDCVCQHHHGVDVMSEESISSLHTLMMETVSKTLDGNSVQDSIPSRGNRFSPSPKTNSRSNQPPIQWVLGFHSPRIRWLRHEDDHSHPRANIKNAWSYTSTPPTVLHGVVFHLKYTKL